MIYFNKSFETDCDDIKVNGAAVFHSIEGNVVKSINFFLIEKLGQLNIIKTFLKITTMYLDYYSGAGITDIIVYFKTFTVNT